MWVAGLALAFLVGFFTGNTKRGILGRIGTLGLAVLAVVGLSLGGRCHAGVPRPTAGGGHRPPLR